MTSSEYEVVNCLLSNDNHRLCVVKAKGGKEQFLMKSSQVDASGPELVKRQRYKRELEFVSTFDHPNIFKPLSSENIDTSLSIIYPFRKGTTLQRFFTAQVTLSIAEKLKMIIQLVEALEHIHSRGIVHGDLHPGNIFVREDRGVELYDFSMCMTVEEVSRGQDGAVIGTYPYLSPEQTGFTRFKVDTRSDLYCAGIILYQLLSNRFPFAAKTGTIEELLDYMLKTELEPIRSIPYYINEILLKALRSTPEERYQTASGLKYDLKMALDIIQNETVSQEFVPGEKDTIIAVSRLRFFIAREKEIEMLNKGLAALRQKESLTFLLSGTSGIGKSEIIRSFIAAEEIGSVYVVSVRCNRFTPNQPYSVIRSLLLDFLAKVQDKDTKDKALLRKHLNTVYPEYSGIICDVIPEMRGYFDSVQHIELVGKEREAERISYILISILDVICASFPVIFVVDDLQWIDSLSFELLMRLRQSEAPKLIIFAHHTDSTDEKHIFKYALNDVADKIIEIQPFSRNETVWLVYSIFDQVKNEDILIDVLEHKCNGNPFILNQMIRYLLDSSIIRKINGNWVFIPELINEIPGNFDSVSLIKHKLSNLSERELRYLKIGSLMGGIIELQILGEIGGFDEPQSKIILKKLEAEGILVTNFKGEVRFAHDKIQEVVLSGINIQEKTLIYESLAVEYEALSDTKMEFLFDAAEMYRKTSQLEKAVELSVKAGKYAVEKAAYDLAIADFRNALLMIDQIYQEGKNCRFDKRKIELSLAEALMLTGKNEQALAIFNQYTACGEADSLENCDIMFKVGTIYLNMGRYNRAQDYFHKALILLHIKIPKNRIRLILNSFVQIIFSYILSSPLKKIISRKENPQKTLGIKILNRYAYSLYFTNINYCFFPHFLALNFSKMIDNCIEKTEAHLQHAIILYQVFLKKAAFRVLDKINESVRYSGKKNLSAYTKTISGILHFYTTQWKQSEKEFLESISEYKTKCDNLNQIICLEHLYRIYLFRGDLKRAQEHISHAVSLIDSAHERIETKPVLAEKAIIECISGVKNDNKKELRHLFSTDSDIPFFVKARLKTLQLEYEILRENYSDAWKISSQLNSEVSGIWLSSEFSAYFHSLNCELATRELLNSCVSSVLIEEKKIKSTLSRSVRMLLVASRKYPAYKGRAYRFMGWYFYLLHKNRKIADKYFKMSISSCHNLQMKIEEAKSLRDYGIFNDECNYPGVATDLYDTAFKMFKQCGAQLEIQRILDKVSPECRKLFIDDTGKNSLISAENSNQIRFDTLLQVSSSISEITEFSVLLNQILSGMIKATGAQYGCIFVKGQEEHLQCMLKLDFQGNELSDEDVIISRSIVNKAEQNRQVLLISDGGDECIEGNKDTERIRSVLCVPLYREENFLGCVYLGNDKVAGLFSEIAVKTAQILSAHAGILLENAYLMEKYKQLNRDLDSKVRQQTHDMLEKNRQLELANLKLVESERVKGVLSGTLVHDIKNYAAGIEGNLQYLGRKLEQDEKVKRVLDVVSETCSDIVSLASNLLDIAKMDEGKLVVRAEVMDASYIVSIAEKFSINTLFEEKEIHPVISSAPKNFSIYADVYLLERVLQNLFSNAAKYVPRQGKVELHFIPGQKENILCFFNSGVAIPEKEREVLFEKYARIENHHSQYSKGLGLFFCRMVMNAHKGRIWVDSDEKGNNFKLAFPNQHTDKEQSPAVS